MKLVDDTLDNLKGVHERAIGYFEDCINQAKELKRQHELELEKLKQDSADKIARVEKERDEANNRTSELMEGFTMIAKMNQDFSDKIVKVFQTK